MPWNECKPMDERLRFAARLLEGEKMAPLCREFDISRVTDYKTFGRYPSDAFNTHDVCATCFSPHRFERLVRRAHIERLRRRE